MLRIFFIFLFSVCSSFCFSQRNCGTNRIHEDHKHTDAELYNSQENFKKEIDSILENRRRKGLRVAALTDTLTIPVVVHVIYKNATTNISDLQIISQIDVLNEDYRRKSGTNGFNNNPVGADTEIEFCLATMDPNGEITNGIVRKFNSKAFWTLSDESSLKAQSRWPSDQYLNIWVCQLEEPDPSLPDIIGYSTYPSGFPLPGSPGPTSADLDGVVIDYRAFGKSSVPGSTAGTGGRSFYNLGRTATHEIGHWLGLYHIWGQDDVNGCSTDYVSDTPLDREPNSSPTCKDSSDCDGNGVYTLDMTNNYLDYSPDACMNLFTQGQKDRMRTVIEFAPRRASLLGSMGCCVPVQTEELPIAEDFEGSTLPDWNIINPDALSPTWTVTGPGAYGSSSNSLKIQNTFSPAGNIDYLQSDYVKMKIDKPAIEFDLAYALNSAAVSDCLVVEYSLNCLTWIPILTLTGSSLTTTNRIADNFTPLENEWKRIRVDLDPMDKKPVGRVRFTNYSKGGNTLYIDNIDIYKTSVSLVVTPYPNPTTGKLNVEVINDKPDNIRYELFDMLGQRIWEQTDYQKTTYTKTIELSGLSRGMYILRVSDSKQRASRKILYTY